MKRALLTGASGFVGRHAVEPLLARGYEIHAVSSRNCVAVDPRMRWHRADLLDGAATARLVAEVGATHLLHFAWYTEHGRFWDAPENEAWRRASLALVEAFRMGGGHRAVLAGTCAEYAASAVPCSEARTPCDPASQYGRSKLALRDAFHAYCRSSGLSGAWGRIFFLYGPGEPPGRLFPSVVRAIAEGRRAACSHGRQVRDFLHVRDVAAAFVALLDGAVEGDVNIASGEPVTVRAFALAAAAACGAPDRVDFGTVPASRCEIPVIVADVGRLRDDVGWQPRFDLAAGVADAAVALLAASEA